MKILKKLMSWFGKSKEVNKTNKKAIIQTKEESEYITIKTRNKEDDNHNKKLDNLRSEENKAIKEVIISENKVSDTLENKEKEFENCVKEESINDLENNISHENDEMIDKDLDNSLMKNHDVELVILEDSIEGDIYKEDFISNICIEENKEDKLKTKHITDLVNVINKYSNEKLRKEEEKLDGVLKFQSVLKQYINIVEEKSLSEENSANEAIKLYEHKNEKENLILEEHKKYKTNNKVELTLIENNKSIKDDLSRKEEQEYYTQMNFDTTTKFEEYGKEIYQGELGKIKILEALTTDKKLSSINIKTWKRFCDKPLTKFANENFDELSILIYSNLDEFREAFKVNKILLHKGWYMNPITVREKMYEDITFIFRYSENYLREKKGNSRKLTLGYTNKLVKNIEDYLQKNCDLIYADLEKQEIEKKLNKQKSKTQLKIEDEIEKLINDSEDNFGFDITLDVDLKDYNNVQTVRKNDNKETVKKTKDEKLDVSIRAVSEEKKDELDEIMKGVDDFII